MFKTILKVFRIFKYEYVQVWAPIVTFIITIIWGFGGFSLKNDINYWKNWENACVFSTVFYTILLFITGLFGGRFVGLIDLQVNADLKEFLKEHLKKVGTIVSSLIIIVIFAIFIGKENLLLIDIPLNRIELMALYFFISLLYLKINKILAKSNIPEKDEMKNSILYCDGPISFTFLILVIYAMVLGSQKINDLGINPFFSGAIAFQMILSNIIWGIIDNSQRIKKYSGG